MNWLSHRSTVDRFILSVIVLAYCVDLRETASPCACLKPSLLFSGYAHSGYSTVGRWLLRQNRIVSVSSLQCRRRRLSPLCSECVPCDFVLNRSSWLIFLRSCLLSHNWCSPSLRTCHFFTGARLCFISVVIITFYAVAHFQRIVRWRLL